MYNITKKRGTAVILLPVFCILSVIFAVAMIGIRLSGGLAGERERGDEETEMLDEDFLNALIQTDELPRTILYSLNPNDNQAIGTILGCFQDSTAVAKIQQGSAWWFNDHKPGMQEQMTSLATLGNLSGFVGMLTDARSFLSYTRHEYFRRILCNMIGNWVENGEFPADFDTLSEIVKDISYYNAKRYFKFDI